MATWTCPACGESFILNDHGYAPTCGCSSKTITDAYAYGEWTVCPGCQGWGCETCMPCRDPDCCPQPLRDEEKI
jgi:hypothetical protein